MESVILHQRTESIPAVGFKLTTIICSQETGEIYKKETIVRYSFYWDSIIEAVSDDAVKWAVSNGYEVSALDTPFKFLNDREDIRWKGLTNQK
jgi:hypothetical protein